MWNRCHYVYIIANATPILYIGITNITSDACGSTRLGRLTGSPAISTCRLVYYESFDDVRKAITREKQIKGWRREKKIWLIERVNRNWKDLSDGWYPELKNTTKALPLDSR